MRRRFDKNMKIITDLTSYCHSFGARNIEMSMSLQDDRTVCTIKADVSSYTEHERSYLQDRLNTHRQHEIEQSYWLLGGDVDTEPEIELVGMMVDAAEVEYSGNTLTIDVLRLEEDI